MLPTKRKIHNAPTREVHGEFPVHFHYTPGIANKKFFNGLKDQKIFGNTCDACNKTYLPPKIFCEDCFDELGEETYKELSSTGTLFSFSEAQYDHRGDKLIQPQVIALIKIDGSDTTFYHKLVGISNPTIGMKVKVRWNSERTSSLFDIEGFETA